MSTPTPSTQAEYSVRADWGIELGRGLAAFGVVVIHSPMGKGTSLSPEASAFISVWFFVVPFFLIAAFYYAWSSFAKRTAKDIFVGRLKRLIGPFLLWTGLYAFARAALYLSRNDLQSMKALFADPVGLFLLGDAALHLYYVPLLAAGLTWFIAIEKTPTKLRQPICIAGLLLSFGASWALGTSGNGFGPSTHGFTTLKSHSHWAANGLFTVPFAWAACMIQTSPYFFAAGLLTGVRDHLDFFRRMWAGSAGALSALAFMTWFRFLPMAEFAAGTCLFVGLLFQSQPTGSLTWFRFIGGFSAGCFFSHHLFLEMFQIASKRFRPELGQDTPLWFIVGLALAATVVSYTATAIFARLGRFGRMLSAS